MWNREAGLVIFKHDSEFYRDLELKGPVDILTSPDNEVFGDLGFSGIKCLDSYPPVIMRTRATGIVDFSVQCLAL